MSSSTPRQLLDAARSGDLERLGAERNAVADAVRSFADAGDGASALELVAGAWRIWFSRGELEQGSAAVASRSMRLERATPLRRARVLSVPTHRSRSARGIGSAPALATRRR